MNANETIGRLLGVDMFHHANKDGVMVNSNVMDLSSSLVVGVEIELENTRILEVDYWQSTNDSSLRNNGIEYVSVPFHVNKADVVLESLINQLPTESEASGRCGLHVHLNCLDLTEAKLRKLIKVVYDREEELFARSGNRNDNLFCVPWHGSYSEPALLAYFKGQMNLRDLIHSCKKYAGINLCPLFQRGTIEFRMHKGSKFTEEILSWINYLVNFKRYVLET